MELRRYLHLIRRRLLLVVVITLAGVAGGYLVGHRTPTYRAQTSVYIGARQLAASSASADALAALDRQAQTFAALIKTPPVAQGAVQTTHAPRTAAQVTASTRAAVVANTNLIQISVTDTSPAVAQVLADGVAQAFIAQIGSLEPGTGAGTSPTVSVFAQASLPTTPGATGERRDMALGGLLGLIAALAVVLAANYLDVAVRGAGELERRLDLPVLGVIPFHRQPAPASSPAEGKRRQPAPVPAKTQRSISSGPGRG